MERLTAEQMRSEGYLQEVNRRFFHPLGLALALTIDDKTAMSAEVWDERDDPEGWFFNPHEIKEEHIIKIDAEIAAKKDVREKACGSIVQPYGVELL